MEQSFDECHKVNNDEDDLVKKLKNIPILPRIPKRQSNSFPNDENGKVLEHRSILEQRDVASLSSEQWKSSGWSSTFSNTSQPRKRLHNVKNGSKDEKTVLRRKFNSDSNKQSCESKFDDMMTGKVDLPTAQPILSHSKRTKHAPKSVKVVKTVDAPQINKSNIVPQEIQRSDSLQNTLSEFECFESRWTAELPRLPCKSLEDRMKERMLLKQGKSQMDCNSLTDSSLSYNNNALVESNICEDGDNKLDVTTDTINLDIDDKNNLYDTPDTYNDCTISKEHKVIDSMTMPPPSMPPPTSKNLLRRKKSAKKKKVPTATLR